MHLESSYHHSLQDDVTFVINFLFYIHVFRLITIIPSLGFFFFYFSLILNVSIFSYRNELSLKVFDAFNGYISMCYPMRISDKVE